MFTGIIEGMGTIKGIKPSGEGLCFGIHPDFPIDDPKEGESISVNGVCLTGTTISESFFSADISPETLSRSTLGLHKKGARVNLERALRFSDRLGGHLVSGHVDCVGEIVEKKPVGKFTIFEISLSPELDRYIIEKGSIAVDGMSLTVNTCSPGRFSVAIIPHTAKLTTIGIKKTGDLVNIETDMIGKYVERFVRGKHWDAKKKGTGNCC
jgi:riboflavin synthase